MLAARFRVLIDSVVGEFRHFAREPMLLSVLLGIPLGYPLIVSWLYSADQVVERPVVLVDADNSSASRRLSIDLDATQALRVVDRVASAQPGFEALREKRAELLVLIPENFSTHLAKRERSPVKVWEYGANVLTYGTASPAIHEVVGHMNSELGARALYRRGISSRRAAARVRPIVQETRFLFHPTASYGGFFMPGILMLVIQQLMLVGLAFSIGARREHGMTEISGRFPFTFLEGIGLAQMLFYLLGIAFAVFGIFPWFGWPVVNPVSILTLFVAFMLAMMPLATLVGSFVRDRYGAFELLMFASVPLFMMSGYAMPADQMPEHMRAIAAIFPATPALQAVRILSTKTGDLAAVTREFVWLGVQFVAYTALAILVVRTRWRRPDTQQPDQSRGRFNA